MFVLLDANVIIEAHASGVWASLVERVTLVVPSTVLREAAFYIDRAMQAQVRIDLSMALQQGAIREVSATAEQLARFMDRFDRVFVERMDSGEAEALALLLDGTLPDHHFCTSDGPAIRALSLLDMPEIGISLELMLRSAGLSHKLPRQFSTQFFQDMLDRGAAERIRGEGLRKLSPPPTKPDASKHGKKKRR